MAGAPETVIAARLHRHGEPLAAEPVTLATPAAGEVRVELEYGGVNPVDSYVAQGQVAPDVPLPRTLGAEAAGVADGQAVLVAGEGLGSARDGVWAQAAVVPAEAVLELPAGVSTRDAAAMGIAGLTALNVVRKLARVDGEDRVLVLGASGGVGSMTISLARAAGATVWGQTGSSEKAAAIVNQGAERAIVAGPDQLVAQAGEFEPTVVFDPLGGAFVAPVVEMIASRGRIVALGASAGPEVAFNMRTLYRKNVALLGYGGMQLSREQRRSGLQEALEALADGSIRVRIDEVLALADVNDAWSRLRERGVQGKLLLDLG